MRGVMGLPAQTRKDIQIFKSIFDQFSGKEINVFEWGSGFSSIYFAQYLQRRRAHFHWHSIDNNKEWYEKVAFKIKKLGLDPCVDLYFEEFLPFWEKPEWEWKNIPPPRGVFSPKSDSEQRYVQFPKSLKMKFDIVIVDARFRRHCLQTAREVLAPGGVVIVHDAQKKHYHVGLKDYSYGKFYNTGEWFPFQEVQNQLWVGSVDNEKIFETLERF